MSTDPAHAYPVVLRLDGRLCVVVGGGAVALRKARGLLAAGARLRVVAPAILPELATNPSLEILPRPFVAADLDGAVLVFAATNDRLVNAEVAACARSRGIPVNCADAPEESDFHLPAVLQRGPLTVAVSSGGESPALAAALRDRLAESVGPEWGILCEVLGALRRKRLTGAEVNAYNRTVVSHLLAADLPGLLAAGDEAAIDRLLAQATGEQITLAALGIRLGKGTS